MSKGSKRRPEKSGVYQDNWEKVFGEKKKEPKVKARKKTPKQSLTQVHKDKTKYKRKDKYPSVKYEGPWGKDLGLS
tara:strand:- start:1095 stop:1322 length:228 start_codon:yes stop_codon:yes gene_type:complete